MFIVKPNLLSWTMGPVAFSDPIIFTFIQVMLNILLSSVLWFTELVDSRTTGVHGKCLSNVPDGYFLLFARN